MDFWDLTSRNHGPTSESCSSTPISIDTVYPLVNIQKTMEHHHAITGKINYKWWWLEHGFYFSILYIYIGNFIIPTHDSSSFLQRGGEKPPSQQGTSGIGLKLWPWLQLYYKCISIESKLWFSVCSWFIVALDIIRFCKLWLFGTSLCTEFTIVWSRNLKVPDCSKCILDTPTYL